MLKKILTNKTPRPITNQKCIEAAISEVLPPIFRCGVRLGFVFILAGGCDFFFGLPLLS